MAVDKTSLAYRMRQLAKKGHARADELNEKADAFDAAAKHFFSVCDLSLPVYKGVETSAGQKLVAAWRAARAVWREVHKEAEGSTPGHKRMDPEEHW